MLFRHIEHDKFSVETAHKYFKEYSVIDVNEE